jgi:nitrate reductase cytochrome c-type subunit
MIKKLLVLVILLALILAFNSFAGDKKHEYVGVKKCVTCHKSEKQGKQKDIWEKSKHSKTYIQLTSKEGLAKAKTLGIDDPTKSNKCLSCHAPEFDKKELWQKKFKLEQGVQCETCHGPGSAYKKKKIMQDNATAVANGLLIPDEKTCLNCHKKDNPEHKGTFDYKTSWEKIKHPVPKKAEKKS